MEKLKEIIEQNRDKEKPTYEVKTIGYEDRLSPEEERALSKSAVGTILVANGKGGK